MRTVDDGRDRWPRVSRPVVGLTTAVENASWGPWVAPAALLPRSYVDIVALAGGVPLLIPPAAGADSGGTGDDTAGRRTSAAAAVRALDALVLSGGPDVDPSHYGEPALPTTVSHPERDAWELAVLHAALEQGKPVLAICRGMQLLNVACGGTLHQHLPDVVGGRRHLPRPGTFGSTAVRIAPASRLAGVLGGSATGSCHHHQAVHHVGAGLRAAAWADDGTVEAIEHAGHGFVLGVQWHPEQDSADRRLFAALVHAASTTS